VKPVLARCRGLLAPAALSAFVVVLALLANTGSEALGRTLIFAVINLIVVVGLYSFVGLSGVVSFGHMSFMAVGAYASAVLTTPSVVKSLTLTGLPPFIANAQLSALPATLIAGVVAGIVALVLAAPLMRLSGLQAGLATVGLLLIAHVVLGNLDTVTGGTAGLSAIPATTTLTSALAWAVAAIFAVWTFQRSRAGLRLRASREDPVAARSVGISIGRDRTIAFVLSAFLIGVGGALFANYQENLTPDQFYVSVTFLTLAMLVIGGMHSLAGAVVGSILISAVQELLRHVESGLDLGVVSIPGRPGVTEVGLGLFMLAVLIGRPEGVTGGRELAFSRRRARADAA
jgi:branched-chain amino acid transport system permease protein